jgi:hypothetical protein
MSRDGWLPPGVTHADIDRAAEDPNGLWWCSACGAANTVEHDWRCSCCWKEYDEEQDESGSCRA